jgi:hypothetical protein
MIRHGVRNKSLARTGYEVFAPYPTRRTTRICVSTGTVYEPPRSFPAFRWACVEDWAKENVARGDWHEFYRRFGVWLESDNERIEARGDK